MLGLALASASCVPVWESQAPVSFGQAAPRRRLPAGGAPADSANLMLASLLANDRPSAYRGRTALDRLRSLDCLAQAIYYEARSESEDGQRAVAQVVLNRVRHPAWPNSVCGVVYQGPMRAGGGCQFTFTCDGSLSAARRRRLGARAAASPPRRWPAASSRRSASRPLSHQCTSSRPGRRACARRRDRRAQILPPARPAGDARRLQRRLCRQPSRCRARR